MNHQAPDAGPDAQRQLASLPIAVLLLGPGMRVAAANPAAEQFFGRGASRLEDRVLGDLLVFDQPAMAARLSDSELPVSARDITAMVTGVGLRRIDLATAPVADAPGWQLLTVDNQGSLESLNEDSGGEDDPALRGPEVLAHEIKNPLAGIRGAAQLLARKLEEGERKLTDLITDEVDRIAGLIERMQLLSGRTSSPAVACNLHEIIRRAVAVLEAGGAQASNWVPIEEEFDPSLPPVLGAPDALVQVIINLLANAREACADRPAPHIAVRTRFSSGLRMHSAQTGQSVRLPVELRVSDNGHGVSAAMREHVFEPFVTSKKNGQGLGLALVRKLVRDMNGRIAYERDEAAGLTHFRVHLPLAQERVEPSEAEADEDRL